jgi:chitinase
MGALPPIGEWVRLEVPASAVGLEGRTLNGMAFTLFNGRAVWDRAGKLATVIPTVSISDVSVNEGNSGTTSAVFTVTLSSASTQTISVDYATANGTATNASDYVNRSGALVFAPGQTSQPIAISVVGDTILEPNENFFLNLSSPVNATFADSQGVGTIVNDDAPPTISISDASVDEGNSGSTGVVFNVTLSSASSQTISVNYATANGTASTPSDYVAASGSVTFLPGQTSHSIVITVKGDTVAEANETFFVNLSSPVNATIADGQGVGIIRNLSYFEIPVYFHVIRDTDGTGDVAESRLDAQINVLNNAFNGPTFGANVQFFFRKAGVTRSTNHDWFQMEFLNAQQESGAEYEAKRTLRQGGANALNFYTARGGTASPFRFGWATFAEEYASNSCRDGSVVPFTTLPGDNTPNNPFNAGDLPVHEVGHWLGLLHTFEGTTSTSCNNADDKVDDTAAHKDQFIGECPPPSTDTCDTLPGTDPIHNYMTDYSDACKSEFTRGQFERMRDQFITFRQSNTPPQCPVITMSISDATVTEGNSGGAFATFTVTLSGPSTQQIRANFKTVDGTATGGIDYFALASGGATVDFAPGQTSQSFSVQVIGDTTVEANETFFIDLFNPINVKLGDSQGIGTIINDDALPAISINDFSVVEGSVAGFNVTLSSPSTQSISINVAIASGTATIPSDVAGGSSTVIFAPGQTSLALAIQTVDDTIDEPDETFFVNLSNPVNATIADSQGVGTIIDNDPPPMISISDTSVNEGNSGTSSAVFTVTLSSVSGKTISVNYTTANGTATSPSDYVATSGTVTLNPGQPSQSITIPVVGDTVIESNENFFVNLSNPVNVTLADSQGVGTILNDDASPVYEGWVDIADCNSIIGWAADRNRLNTSITVSIYDGNNLVTNIPASDLRSDVGAYLGDNGRHGFAITTPWQFKDGLTHTLRVKFESGTTELSSSPRTITCATYYEIVARHSGKCLDVEGESTAAGARVIQFGCGGWPNQQWRIIHVGGGFFKMVARHSGKVLDVQGAGLDNGTPVWQWDENGTAAQQWEIIDVGGGYFKILARHSGKGLDVAGVSFDDGAQIHQWDYIGAANQQFLLRPVP